MSEDWHWIEEIEQFYKPCTIEDCDCDTRHDFTVRKLIACIKEMRTSLEGMTAFKVDDPIAVALAPICIGKIASETLARCKEGSFE